MAPVLDTLSATSANVNGAVHLTGTYYDAGPQDTHSLTIDWGVGAPQTLPVTGGAFDIVHTYPTSGVNTISVTLTDDDGGATATQLGTWLAATFPNMYCTLDGMTNTQVAAHYKTLFGRNGQSSPGGPPKVDAQVMATALSVYVTNQTLAGTTATAYGFQVSQYGVGIATVNVGSNGAAFGVANGTNLSVMDLLLAVNNQTTGGVLYGGNAGLRTMANSTFTLINESGGN